MNETPAESPSVVPELPDKDARTWGMLAHLASLAGYVIPFGNVIGPLIVWQIKKDEYPFVAEHGKESVNFQITFLIWVAVTIVTFCIGVGIVLAIIAPIYQIVFVIIAAIKANNGEAYRYPLTIRLIN